MVGRFRTRTEKWLHLVQGTVWSNMPAALTEFVGSTSGRTKVNLSDVSRVLMQGNVAVVGAANAQLRLQYSTDNGTTWAYLDGGTTPSISIGTLGYKSSGWVNIVPAARKEVMLRIVGINGDGVADPQVAVVNLRFR
ncbi:MAG: hypothetical protein PHH85_01945 [Candidatus Methanoperedens sp.]|nr:hypothetical protein [Candidatus Methanoperedens sp.]